MKLRLSEKQVVHCTTEEEAIKCCQLAKSMGLAWGDGESYDETWWFWDKKETCYNFSDSCCLDKTTAKATNFQILTAQDFITMHSEPFTGSFESDGTEKTFNNIISVLKYLAPDNQYSYTFSKDKKGFCYYIKDGNIRCTPAIFLIDECNIDHYLHLIDHIPDATKMVKEDGEITKDWKALYELLTIEATAFAKERNKLKEEVAELKIKADKWDAIPQLFCMRGDKDRAEEIKKVFKAKGYSDTNGWRFKCNDHIYVGSTVKCNDHIYIGNTEDSIYYTQIDSDFAKILLATQTITELPPLEPKEDVEEFYLKPTQWFLYKNEYDDEGYWYLGQLCDTQYGRIAAGEHGRIIPYISDTECLLDTTDEPSKKYCFKGVKPFFNQD